MPTSHSQPTEASPLLPKPDPLSEIPPHPVDLSAGLVPEGADPYENEQHNDEAEDGGIVERQVSNNDRLKQYEGLPEVRKKMKYIIPAVAIGVSGFTRELLWTGLIGLADISLGCRPDHYCINLWYNWYRIECFE